MCKPCPPLKPLIAAEYTEPSKCIECGGPGRAHPRDLGGIDGILNYYGSARFRHRDPQTCIDYLKKKLAEAREALK